MKLYKVDFKNAIGNNIVTVPTDSEFLVGLGNGDSTSTAKLFDGETELSAMPSKIGEYTCFRFETDGTPSRKQYKAVINGSNFEDKSLWTISFDEVDYKEYASLALVIPDNINVEDLNYESGQAPVLTSFQTFVYGVDWSTSKPIFHYLETITLTWNADKTAYEIPIDMGGESWCKYIQFSECSEDRLFCNYGQTSYNDLGEYDVTADEGKETVPAPIPYTQNIDLYIICKKMSVAYRDETGITSTEAVEAVKESGKFIVLNGNRYEVDNEMHFINKASFGSRSGNEYLGMTPNSTNQNIVVTGEIDCASDLTIKDPVLIWDNEIYMPQNITIGGTTYKILAKFG